MKDQDLIDAAYIQDILSDPEEGEIIDFNFSDYVDNPVQLRRLKSGISQKELAQKMGVTQAYISKLERTDVVSAKALKKNKLCVGLGNSTKTIVCAINEA
jgi:DNA-binding Xre family transcriptional regulator